MASYIKEKEDTFDMPATESEREKALEIAVSQIEKQYGKGSVMRLGEAGKRFVVDVIPTGSLALDMALGIGGVPRGRIIDIHGAESSGKSTLALHIIAEAQKMGGTAAYIDVEHSLDPGYARKIGVDVDNLYISQPDYAEQALEITEALVRSGAIDVVIVDSVAALVPRAEIEGDMGDPQMGLQARLMSQALRKLTSAISRSRTCAIFINQLREKVGIVFGNPEVTPGGRALKFYASVRIDLRRQDSIKVGDEIRGNRVKARVIKNKMAPPFRVAEFEIMYDRGISREGDIIDLGSQLGIIKKTGSFFAFGDTKLGQGRENAKAFIAQHKEIGAVIEKQIRQTASNAPQPLILDDEEEEEEAEK